MKKRSPLIHVCLAGLLGLSIDPISSFAVEYSKTQMSTWTQETSQVIGGSKDKDAFGNSFAVGDFDGDGIDDVAVGEVGWDTASPPPPGTYVLDPTWGAVHVFYGESGMENAWKTSQRWHRNLSAIQDSSENFDRFGVRLAAGDFNGDEIDDLAIGVPGDTINGNIAAGSVHVLYGIDGDGLTSEDNHILHQGSHNVIGSPETNDSFGSSLAVGNFNCDDYEDLAIGVPGENSAAGAVNVLYGSAAGLSGIDSQLLMQGRTLEGTKLHGASENGDRYGFSLATGNFNGPASGCHNELAIGAPGENTRTGAVFVVKANQHGRLQGPGLLLMQGENGMAGTRLPEEEFGYSLSTGNFYSNVQDASGSMDLAIGVPGEDNNSGMIQVVRGTYLGLATPVVQPGYWTRADIIITQKNPESGDRFGESVASYQLNQSGAHGIVGGAPHENYGSIQDAGAISVVAGPVNSIEVFVQGYPEVDDRFGQAIASGDFNADGLADIIVGATGENTNSQFDAGAFHIFWGQP